MNTSDRKVYIILLIITVILTISTTDGLLYWVLEDKFEMDLDSTRKTEINWMIRNLGFYLIYLILMIFFFACKTMTTRKRTLTKQERELLKELIKRSNIKIPDDWEQGLLVAPVDGVTNSLFLFPRGTLKTERTLGVQVSECQFQDSDGVRVIATLNLDRQGRLLELDLWKTDFSKVRKIGTAFSPVPHNE